MTSGSSSPARNYSLVYLGEEVWSPSVPHVKTYMEKQQKQEDQEGCTPHDSRKLLDICSCTVDHYIRPRMVSLAERGRKLHQHQRGIRLNVLEKKGNEILFYLRKSWRYAHHDEKSKDMYHVRTCAWPAGWHVHIHARQGDLSRHRTFAGWTEQDEDMHQTRKFHQRGLYIREIRVYVF